MRRQALFDLEYYRIFRPAIRMWFRTRSHSPEEQEQNISEFSASQGCHIIASFLFYIEAFGTSSQLEAKVERLMKFYQFTGMKNSEVSHESA